MICRARFRGAGYWLVGACMALSILVGCQRANRSVAAKSDPDASAAALEQIGKVSQPREIERLVRTLSPVDRHQLRQQRERFNALDTEEKARLRRFHRQICQGSSGTELYDVLRRYRDWLATIPDGQRADLLALPAEERIAKIRAIRQSQEASSFRVHAGDIPPEDAMVVARWLHDYVRRHARALLPQLPNSVQSRIQRMQDGRRKQRMLFFEVVKNVNTIQLPNPEPAQLQQLRESLSSEAATRLAELVDLDDSAMAVEHLMTKFAESIRRKMPSKEKLMEFYQNELTVEQRDRIDQLPPDEAHRELRRQFMRQQRHRSGDRREGGRLGPPRRAGTRPASSP